MKKLIVFVLIGLFARLIDGALGMAYGVTSSSLLIAACLRHRTGGCVSIRSPGGSRYNRGIWCVAYKVWKRR